MSRLRGVARNGGIGFLLAFVVVTVLGNRRWGVRAGVLAGALVAGATWQVQGALEEAGDLAGLAEEFDGGNPADDFDGGHPADGTGAADD